MSKRENTVMFVMQRGALFKRTPDGYHPSPHCPHCQLPMFIQMEHTHFHCYRCGCSSEITIKDLDATLDDLAKKAGEAVADGQLTTEVSG